jgi:hypothetical protein
MPTLPEAAASWKFKTPVFVADALELIFASVPVTDLIELPFYF